MLLRPRPPTSTLFPYTTLFRSYAGGDLSGWQQRRYMPLLGGEHGVPFDFDQLLAALAPRTVLISAPRQDDNFSCASVRALVDRARDRKSTRLNSSHVAISYAVICLKQKK